LKIRRFCKADYNLDILSMVDMMLLLLIFFMLTSSFLPLVSLEINLPRLAKASSPLPPSPLILILTREGKVKWGNNEYGVDEIVGKLLLSFGDSLDKKEILLEVDRDARVEDMVRLIDFLKNEGVKKIKIMAISSP